MKKLPLLFIKQSLEAIQKYPEPEKASVFSVLKQLFYLDLAKKTKDKAVKQFIQSAFNGLSSVLEEQQKHQDNRLKGIKISYADLYQHKQFPEPVKKDLANLECIKCFLSLRQNKTHVEHKLLQVITQHYAYLWLTLEQSCDTQIIPEKAPLHDVKPVTQPAATERKAIHYFQPHITSSKSYGTYQKLSKKHPDPFNLHSLNAALPADFKPGCQRQPQPSAPIKPRAYSTYSAHRAELNQDSMTPLKNRYNFLTEPALSTLETTAVLKRKNPTVFISKQRTQEPQAKQERRGRLLTEISKRKREHEINGLHVRDENDSPLQKQKFSP